MSEHKTSAGTFNYTALRDDIRQVLSDLQSAVSSRFQEFERRLEVQFGEVAGRLNQTIFQIAEALQTRLTDVERSDANMKHRLAMLEERITELEKRLNLPPQRVQ